MKKKKKHLQVNDRQPSPEYIKKSVCNNYKFWRPKDEVRETVN